MPGLNHLNALDFQRQDRRGHGLSNKSHVWFTLSHGIFNEIYYPRIDQACIRDMGLIVTDGAIFSPRRNAMPATKWNGWPTACRHSGWSTPAAMAATASKSRL
jgi:hypothetical protein